jgi:hypothetical protein
MNQVTELLQINITGKPNKLTQRSSKTRYSNDYGWIYAGPDCVITAKYAG